MKELYNSDLRAYVLTDALNKVRSIRHTDDYWEAPENGPMAAAVAYLKAFANTYEIATSKFDNVESRVAYLDPKEQAEEYRLGEDKHQFDAGTFGFYQTQHNTPVWRKGLKVTVKTGPARVVGSVDTSLADVNAKLPSRKQIEAVRKAMQAANGQSVQRRAAIRNANLGLAPSDDQESESGSSGFLAKIIKPRKDGEDTSFQRIQMIRGRFWIYRYDPEKRIAFDPHDDHNPNGTPVVAPRMPVEAAHSHYSLPFDLPPVPDKIVDGADYLVAEITFALFSGTSKHVWRILVEVETSAVVYVEPLFDFVNALVFERDPITQTGNTALTSATNNATLNPHRNDVVLQNLDGAVAGNLSLSGTWADVGQVEGANIAPPTEPVGDDFDYEVRTNNFASASGYFHVDRIFRTIANLGFTVTNYMANTNFPVPVDIRCFNNINAHCVGDGMGGIDHVGYGLMDTTDTTNPLGRACDPRVHLHEVLGHGILYEAVDSANMGFAHSAGDALSLIYFDPDSQCKGVDGTPVGKPGDLRFTYVPWHPTLNRRADRLVTDGWGWGGPRDPGFAKYGAEEILLTTLFRFYRSIGGDHPNLGRRQFASRMSMYLILRGIGDLTPATDPDFAREFATQLMTTDQLNWTSEGVFGGAYSKVIRWVFEQQGEYQTPLNMTDGTVMTAGNPPPVDVYIDDGRAGGYDFQHVHWACPNVWNRRNADGIQAHEEAGIGDTNYMYCRVKNRGTAQADNVVVRGYHSLPGAGLNWPADFAPLSTPQVVVGTVDPNNSEDLLIGPFEWTPNVNAYGHDCVLMVVSADGDTANVDNFTAGETIPEWRLVPNDNNVAQRNVNLVPGGGGGEGLMAGLNGISFFVGNPNPARGMMTFQVQLPNILRKRGWKLELVDAQSGFVLKSGQRREVFIKLHKGQDFTRDEIEATADRDIRIDVLHADNTVGGMLYRIDPALVKPYNSRDPDDSKAKDDCTKQAQQLADCLGIGQKIDSVCVKEVIVGLKIKPDDCC